MNPKVDLYLEEGCGRCSLYQTPRCKVHRWTNELKELRRIVLECGLDEAYKWSQPCYMFQKSNVLILAAFKEYAVLAFFKGVLLADPDKILVPPGESSQAFRQLRFTSVKDILEKETSVKAYIFEAIEVEKLGLKVKFNRDPVPIPAELQERFDANPAFRAAFEALTPGRQRGYLLHFSQARQASTRISRIEKCMPKIFDGKGLNDR